jgi:UMF1 family MFS transporter
MQSPTQRARFGWCLYDWANSAFATVILATVLPVYFVDLVPQSGARLPLTGHTVQASALWSYSVSLSMLLVALAAPYMGSWADRLGAHRRMLGGFCLAGAAATCLLYFAGGQRYLLAASLFILANMGFALANIFYNAFLPVLARGKDMDRLSAKGFGLGYVGGGLALALVALFIYKHQFFGVATRAEATRLGFLFTGLWWAGFALPSLLALGSVRYPKRLAAIPPGLKGYFRILSEAAGYRDLLVFLIAFLFYNDGIQTVIAVSAVFAREVLELSPASILGCFLMVQFVAMPGALAFGRLAERYGAKRAVLASLLLFMGVTVYAFTIDSGLEFWILGFAVALILGGSQATSRSLFGSLIPENRSAEFFGFYTLSGKFASILGPFLFALMADVTGSTQMAILVLNLFFLTGIVLLCLVDVRRGQRAAAGGTA